MEWKNLNKTYIQWIFAGSSPTATMAIPTAFVSLAAGSMEFLVFWASPKSPVPWQTNGSTPSWLGFCPPFFFSQGFVAVCLDGKKWWKNPSSWRWVSAEIGRVWWVGRFLLIEISGTFKSNNLRRVLFWSPCRWIAVVRFSCCPLVRGCLLIGQFWSKEAAWMKV